MRRLRGEGELAGVAGGAAACSGASEWGASERANGMGRWGFCSARARARRGRRPQPWPGHGDGEVATVRRLWAAWRRRGHQREAKAVEEEQRDAWALARSRTWAETEQRS